MSMLQVCAPVSGGVGLTSYFCLSSSSIGSYVLKCCFILRMEEQEGMGGGESMYGSSVWVGVHFERRRVYVLFDVAEQPGLLLEHPPVVHTVIVPLLLYTDILLFCQPGRSMGVWGGMKEARR